MSTRTLSISDVIDIRREATLGTSTADMAAHYDVDQRTIRKVISGERWSSIPQDRTIKGHSNYEITADGRIWSNTKQGYLVLDTVGGIAQARLSKTKKDGTRAYTRVNVSDLVQTYFG